MLKTLYAFDEYSSRDVYFLIAVCAKKLSVAAGLNDQHPEQLRLERVKE